MWIAIVAVFGVGFLMSFFMADVPLHNYTDDKWNRKVVVATGERRESIAGSEESGSASVSSRDGKSMENIEKSGQP